MAVGPRWQSQWTTPSRLWKISPGYINVCNHQDSVLFPLYFKLNEWTQNYQTLDYNVCIMYIHIWPIPNILRPRPGPRLLLAQISVRTKTWTVSVLMARTETVRDRAWSPLQWLYVANALCGAHHVGMGCAGSESELSRKLERLRYCWFVD